MLVRSNIALVNILSTPPPLPLFFSNLLNVNYAILIKSMLLFSQGCLDLDIDVSGPITAFKQILLRKYFPEENNATEKTSIFDCVAECFTKTNYFMYYVSIITIVVMWISFNKTSVRIIKSIIVLLTPFHNTSTIVLWRNGYV